MCIVRILLCMDTIQAGQQVLRNAESELRDLIQKALSEQRYPAVKILADFADGVSNLLQSTGKSTSLVAPISSERQVQVDAAQKIDAASGPPKQNRPRADKPKYPRFERDDDRLVKVGWSKKSKKEYEHRVPKNVVISFVRHIGQNVGTGKIFDVEGLLPAQDASGNEVPTYQVYVTLAWLRDGGALEKKGRDGYVLHNRAVSHGSIDGLWESLPDRSA